METFQEAIEKTAEQFREAGFDATVTHYANHSVTTLKYPAPTSRGVERMEKKASEIEAGDKLLADDGTIKVVRSVERGFARFEPGNRMGRMINFTDGTWHQGHPESELELP